MTELQNLRANLGSLIDALDITQIELAESYGTKSPWVSNVLAGKISPIMENWERLVVAINDAILRRKIRKFRVSLKLLMEAPEDFQNKIEEKLGVLT